MVKSWLRIPKEKEYRLRESDWKSRPSDRF